MKKSSFANWEASPKLLLISLIAVASLILIVNSSCKKGKAKAAPPEKETPVVQPPPKEEKPVEEESVVKIVPNDGKDDTRAIQNAIDEAAIKGGGTVTLPAGDYNVNADSAIYIRSNVTLSMNENTRLIVAPNTKERYYVIKITNVQNAKVLGGQIIGERDKHIGTTGEWGMGVAILGSDNISIEDMRISDCWGDGIYIGSTGGKPASNIIIRKVLCRNNRRQGVSIIEASGVTIDSCEFSNTNGTLPMDGIDIEPNSGIAENITITNCRIFGNKGNGVETNAKKSTTAVIRNITVQNNEIFNNAYSGYCQNTSDITFTNNWLYENKWGNNRVHLTNCINSVSEPNAYKKKP